MSRRRVHHRSIRFCAPILLLAIALGCAGRISTLAIAQQRPSSPEGILAPARADEAGGKWSDAAAKYEALLGAGTLDPSVRAAALAGYIHCRGMMDKWWWKSPLSRWFYLYGGAFLYSCGIAICILVVFSILRLVRVTSLFLFGLQLLLVRDYRGQARINPTKALTQDAPGAEFAAEMLAASEEIRCRLLGEKQTWAAKHIAFLTPSFSDFGTLAGSVPRIQQVDVAAWLQFMVKVAQAFQWNVNTGLAISPPDHASAPTPAPAEIPFGAQITGSAVLQCGWFVKKSWLRRASVVDRSTLRDLARHLTQLVAGEAFLSRRNRKFSAAESFHWFVEGVRYLQLYDDEANKDAPSQPVLKGRLLQAEDALRNCVTTYPDDLLPHYYMGMVFTYHAQVEQALYLQSLISDGPLTRSTLLLLCPQVKSYLKRAAEEFGRAAQGSDKDLRSYALYNQAQALAKLDDI